MVCRITHGILRLLNKGATALPGKIALRLCPDVLEITARGVSTLAITGTNGKTTSARMVHKALENAGVDAFTNRSGANLMGGIACEFIKNTDIFMRPRKKWAVIECDEAASRLVFAAIKPRAVLVTNLFCDQLDRYGSVKAPRDAIVKGLSASRDTILCLNADSQLTASISELVPNKAVFFGLQGGEKTIAESGEDSRCLNCGAKLHYDYVTYANLGAYHCRRCGAGRHTPEVTAGGILPDGTFILSRGREKELCTPALKGLYNVYNAAGAAALVTAAGFELCCAVRAAESFECGFGRMERFSLGKVGASMILIKNAAAADQTLDYISSVKGGKSLVFAINNRPADGTDLSWLDSTDFSRLTRMPGLIRVYVCGDARRQTAERLSRENIKFTAVEDYGELINTLSEHDTYIYILPSYTAMLELRQLLVRRLGGKNFWE